MGQIYFAPQILLSLFQLFPHFYTWPQATADLLPVTID